MTDIQLQKDIAKSLRVFLKDEGIMMVLGEKFEDIKVYEQELPQKYNEEDEELRNYIVVMISEETIVDDGWKVEIHFSINIEDWDKECSGYINIMYLMNEIFLHFTKQGIVGKHGRMETKEAHKYLNLDLVRPHYQGDLITYWILPLPNEEGLEEFI